MRSPYRCGDDDVARMGRKLRELKARHVTDSDLWASYEAAFAVKVRRVLDSTSPDVPVLRYWIQRVHAAEHAHREIVEAAEAGLRCARQLARVRRSISYRYASGRSIAVASVSMNPALAKMIRRAQALMQAYLREIVDIPISPGGTWNTQLLDAFVTQLGKRGGTVSHRSALRLVGGIAQRVRVTQDALIAYAGDVEREHAEAMRGYVAAVERAT